MQSILKAIQVLLIYAEEQELSTATVLYHKNALRASCFTFL